MSAKLIYAVIHVGQAMIDAVVDDSGGHRRKIKYTMHSKEHTDVPEANWFQCITGEVEYQQAREADEAKGRVLPKF